MCVEGGVGDRDPDLAWVLGGGEGVQGWFSGAVSPGGVVRDGFP